MKFKHIIPIILISSVIFSGCGSSDSYETITTEGISEESTALTFTTTEVTNQETSTQDTILKKDTYRKLDESIWQTYTALSAVNALTINKLNQYLNKKCSTDELYALAKKNKDILPTTREYLDSFEELNNEPYYTEVKNYSNYIIDASNNIMQFIENTDISYLEKALSITEESIENYKNILAERTKFLERYGFTSDEIESIISESGSSAN